MYADTFYDYFNFDGVTISPYMGVDAGKPFIRENKVGILLVVTSNKNAFEVQNILSHRGRLTLCTNNVYILSYLENLKFQ